MVTLKYYTILYEELGHHGWHLRGVLEPIPHGYGGMAVHWGLWVLDLFMIKWKCTYPPIGFCGFCFLRNLVEMRVVLFSITVYQTTPKPSGLK